MKKSEHIRKALEYSKTSHDFGAFLQLCRAIGMESHEGTDSFLARLASEMEEQERREESSPIVTHHYIPRGTTLYIDGMMITAVERDAYVPSAMFENRKRSAPFSDIAKQVAETQTKPGVPCCRKHAESVWMFNDLWKDLKESCDG